MGEINNLFINQIDGERLSDSQSARIENVFNTLKGGRNSLPFFTFIGLFGHFVPDKVLKIFFSNHNQYYDELSLDIFKRFLWFLLNGTCEDKIKALYYYYTGGLSSACTNTVRESLEAECIPVNSLDSIIKRGKVIFDEFHEYFILHRDATNMSTWLLSSNLTLASPIQSRISKELIYSVSSGIHKETYNALLYEYHLITDSETSLISEKSFREKLADILPASLLTGLFNIFDSKGDGYIDIIEFFTMISVLSRATEVDYAKYVFQMYTQKSPKGNRFAFEHFEHVLQDVVPPYILKEALCGISAIRGCSSLSTFSSWTKNNPVFLYLVNFIKASVYIVFGLPPPWSESELSKMVTVWLDYTIMGRTVLGTRWFITSSPHWPSLIAERGSKVLKSLDLKNTYEFNHPISMYKQLLISSATSNTSTVLAKPRLRSKMRDRTFEDGLNKENQADLIRRRKSLKWILHRRHEPQIGREEDTLPSTSRKGRYQRSGAQSRRASSRSFNRGSNCASLSPGSDRMLAEKAQVFAKTGRVSFFKSHLEGLENEAQNEKTEEPRLAVDRRLAQRIHSWYRTCGETGFDVNSEIEPSYLISYTPENATTPTETLELHPLKICVRWLTGSTSNVVPQSTCPIIDVQEPQNPHLEQSPLSLHPQKSSRKKTLTSRSHKYSTFSDSNAGRFTTVLSTASLPNLGATSKDPDHISVSSQELSSKSLIFVFSRCHTISEVCSTISERFCAYHNRKFIPENYRVWYVNSFEHVDALWQRRKVSQTTRRGNVSNSGAPKYANGESNGEGSRKLLAPVKRVGLDLVDLKKMGNQQLANFLAYQRPLERSCNKLFEPQERCSATFTFVIEYRPPLLTWPLGTSSPEGSAFLGLKNAGNMCYFNSVIQCLRMTPFLTNEIARCSPSESSLAREYIGLVSQMNRGGSSVSPRELQKAFFKKWLNFKSDLQQDAQEFLTIFLDTLNEELKVKPSSQERAASTVQVNESQRGTKNSVCGFQKVWEAFCSQNDSPITRRFYGIYESRCLFEECSHKSSAFDPFSSFTLPLPAGEINFIILTVVPSYGAVPEVIRLERNRSIDASFVLLELSRRYNCYSSQIYLGQKKDGVLTSFSSETGKFDNHLNLWAFILPKSLSDSPREQGLTVIVQGRILTPARIPLLEQTATQPELNGPPVVCRVSNTTTNRELYAIVEKCIARYHLSSATPRLHKNCQKTALALKDIVNDYQTSTRICSALEFCNSDAGKYIFELKHADKHWWRCSKCSWPRMCRGCSIPCNSEKVNLRAKNDGKCVYLAADWNIAAFINEYQCAAAIERKMIDKIDDSEWKIRNNLRLADLLETFFADEVVSEDQGVLCERCRRKKGFTRSTSICVLPEVLLISLKRFQENHHTWRKSSRLVDFPLTGLDMRPYLSTESKCTDTQYDLYGVVNHYGGMNRGHYFAFIRHETGRWFQLNDVECSEIGKDSIVTPEAYLLFYERRHQD